MTTPTPKATTHDEIDETTTAANYLFALSAACAMLATILYYLGI